MQRHHFHRETQLRAIGIIEEGRNIRDVADAVNSTTSTIGRLWQRYRETGEVRERDILVLEGQLSLYMTDLSGFKHF